MFRVGIFDHPAAAEPAAAAADVRTAADLRLARTVAEQGTVLLKNDGALLPLGARRQTIAVIGPGAGQHGAEMFYNGAGSGHVNAAGAVPGVVSPLQGITQRARSLGDRVLYADGSSPAAASSAATSASVAIVFVGAETGEGNDRSTLALRSGNCSLFVCTPEPVNQDALIAKVAAANRHTIVVLNTGGPVLMPWIAHVKGLLEAWYPGQQDGNAIAAILFGDVNPSARLPETFPRSRSQIPTRTTKQYPGVNDRAGIPHASYSEGLLVGYRWYDAKRIAPLFPFGFGLSYTTFDYGELRLLAGQTGAALATATFKVTNSGHRAGADVPQLYIDDPAASREPPKQLKAFARIALRPGASAQVSFQIDRRALSYWDSRTQAWAVARGCYRVLVGHSSRAIVMRAVLAVNGAHCPGATASIWTRGTSARRSRRSRQSP